MNEHGSTTSLQTRRFIYELYPELKAEPLDLKSVDLHLGQTGASYDITATADCQNDSETKPFINEPTYSPNDWTTLRPWYSLKHDMFFSFYLLFTTIMFILPWVFFGIVSVLGGIKLHGSVAERNPKDTSYVVTAISNIIAAIIIHLFSTAVACLAQKRVVHKGVAISEVSFLTALKNRAPRLSLLYQGRHDLFIMVILYWIIFLAITPGIVTLLTPTHFIHSVPLHGQELNFTASDPDCISWFQNYTISDSCDWKVSFV